MVKLEEIIKEAGRQPPPRPVLKSVKPAHKDEGGSQQTTASGIVDA
jgi:hypothetical protein